MEIERKFLIKELPENLDSYPFHIIEQGYLNTAPTIRIRKSDSDYYLTYKGSGMMAREEYNLPLTKDSYEHLKEKVDGKLISKKRILIPIEHPVFNEGYQPPAELSLTIELDLFSSPVQFVMAEVEFDTIEMANAFIKPDWFDEDVTLNPKYHNSNISKIK